MILGLPSVAADVGGVRDLLRDGSEGYIYAPGDVEKLAEHIVRIFALEQNGEALGQAAKDHALATHDPETNLNALIDIYKTIC